MTHTPSQAIRFGMTDAEYQRFLLGGVTRNVRAASERYERKKDMARRERRRDWAASGFHLYCWEGVR